MAEQLKGKRTALKGWVTRLTAQLTELCSDDRPDIEILADSITQLQSKLNNLDTVQSEIESKLPASELDADLEEAFNFKQKARLIKIKASSFLADGKVSNEGKSDGSVSGAKLPKIELPKFSGNILEWCSFQEQFDSVIHNNPQIKPLAKFSYLRSLLHGEALSCISGFSLTEANYSAARGLLIDRYNKTERITFAHIEELLTLSAPNRSSVTTLRSFEDRLLTHIRCLEVLGVGGKNYGVVLTPLILSRLPSDLRLEWARGGEGKESDLEYLLEFLHSEINRRERSQAFSESKLAPQVNVESRRPPAAAAALISSESRGKYCPLCPEQNHEIEKCRDFRNAPVSERWEMIRKAKLCFSCLSGEHFTSECDKQCKVCGRLGHHTFLHENKR